MISDFGAKNTNYQNDAFSMEESYSNSFLQQTVTDNRFWGLFFFIDTEFWVLIFLITIFRCKFY